MEEVEADIVEVEEVASNASSDRDDSEGIIKILYFFLANGFILLQMMMRQTRPGL